MAYQKKTSSIIKSIIVACISILIGIYAYFYILNVYSKADEDARVVAYVSAIVEVPEGETPDVGTVTDPQKLTGQPFFKHSQAGDKVIVYKSIGKAILYRPSTKKIIEIAPILTLQQSTK